MGDRGNIVVQDKDKTQRVWLYTHWCGSEITTIAKRALKREQRWTDAAYLARIIFCEMLRGTLGNVLDGETGFGISTTKCDNSHPILVVDVGAQSVYYENDDGSAHGLALPFKQFIK